MFEFYQVNPLAMKGLMPSEQFSAMSWRVQVTFCFQYCTCIIIVTFFNYFILIKSKELGVSVVLSYFLCLFLDNMLVL